MNRAITLPAAVLALVAGTAVAGPLDPPAGPVTSTGKTLTEIEPRVAISTTATPGDNDATPSTFKITQSGSYYLTQNIQGTQGKTVIEITAPNVTLDLNGFTITGGSTVISSLGQASLTVRNGHLFYPVATGVHSTCLLTRIENVTVRSGGSWGFDLGANSLVEGCSITNCVGGVKVGSNSRVRNTVAATSAQIGFTGNSTVGTTFESCSASGSGTIGFDLGASAGAMVKDCTASGSGGNGFHGGERTLFQGCISTSNSGHGFALTGNSTLKDSQASYSGLGGSANGVSVSSSGNSVLNCQFHANSGYAISISAGATRNVVMGNLMRSNGGTINASAGSDVAPIVTNPGSNGFAGVSSISNIAF